MAAKLEVIFRAIKGEADQAERAVKGKNKRLICKYRTNLEQSLKDLYKELGCAELSDDERKRLGV